MLNIVQLAMRLAVTIAKPNLANEKSRVPVHFSSHYKIEDSYE